MRVVALFAVLLAAGCVTEPLGPAGVVDPVPATMADVMVHRAAGIVEDAIALPEALEAVLHSLGVDAIEPTLGTTADGAIFYAALSGRGPAIGSTPSVMRSRDAGATWEDVSPRVAGAVTAPPETNDPYLYVDPATDRIFQFAMAPILVCAVLSWSDDGGETWTTNPRGCGNTPPWDHQAMVAAAPRGVPTLGYENVLVQCVNNLAASTCSRSLDGGLTWSTGAPSFVDANCGGLHGHPVADAEGVLYLPKMNCGAPLVIISEDSGLTWESVLVSDVAGHAWPDPAMAIDDAGNVYYAYVDEVGALLLSVSTDGGRAWSTPVVASPPGLTAHIPALAAGADGRVVLAYPATADLPEGYGSSEKAQNDARWHAYLTLATDALAEDPTFATVRATPADDPLVRGPCGPARCPGMIDFIDVVVGPDGRPYAAFVDACSVECASADKPQNDQSLAILVTLTSGPSLRP